MPISVGLDELSHAITREQEDEKEKESNFKENRMSLENYIGTEFNFGSLEPDLITSTENQDLKNYCVAQDAIYWEKELKDVMENVQRVHKALSENAKIEEMFRFRLEDFKDPKIIKSNVDLKISLEEIQKMDAILRVKVNEEKKAKLSRIQAEEESRHILTKLPCPKTSGGMKVNLEEFMRLLNEVEKIECDSLSCNPIEMSGCFKDNMKGEEKKEEGTHQQRKANNLKFVERNIQLAKCGRGTLSLTDEEKSRIESLLTDLELSNMRITKKSKEVGVLKAKNNFEGYGIDNETKSVLNQIDERLEVIGEMRRTKGYPTEIRWLKKNDCQSRISDENEKGKENESKKEGKRDEKKEQNCLKKINQQLHYINTISEEEIYPLTEEELEKLIQESKESSDNGKDSASENALCPHKLISELVSNAKLLMPKFKYRFDQC